MIVIVMGVTGAGKTTIGRLLAQQLGWEFADADDFHSTASVEKISQGIPLTDEDRAPWLDSLHNAIVQWIAAKKNVVLACSALKQMYRERLCVGPEVKLVYLKGSYQLIAGRLRERRGHFATAQLLTSQFADLEEPADAVAFNVNQTPLQLVAEIRSQLRLDAIEPTKKASSHEN